MKQITLKPDQILTLNDFPVHNLHVLKMYFKIFKEGYGKIIPPCPVINKKLIKPFLKKEVKEMLEKFEKDNLEVEYFLLDGSHKTSAAALTHQKIKVMVFETDKDIKEAKQLVETGDLLSLSVEPTIKENIKFFNKHFKKKIGFYTVKQKALRMIKEKVIPNYMCKYYWGLK